MQHTLATFAIFVVVAAPAAAQNLALNGDFERNESTGCDFNLSNSVFDATMPGCTGFSTTLQGNGEIDVMQGSDCGYGLPAPSGSTKLGIASNGDGTGIDAFSITLSKPLVPGRFYRLTFQANAYVSDFSPEIGAVEVGLSQSPTEFGTRVGELVPSAQIWSGFNEVIVPTTAATFLTVRHQETADGWNHVDNFTLEATGPAGLALSADGSTIRVEGATPGSLVAFLVSPAEAWEQTCAESLLSLAPPVTLAAVLVADGMGSATCEQKHVSDAPLHLQAVDLSTGEVSHVVTMDLGSSADLDQLNSARPATSSHGPAEGGNDQPGTSKASPPTRLRQG